MRPASELIEKIRKYSQIPFDKPVLTHEEKVLCEEMTSLRVGPILFQEIDTLRTENECEYNTRIEIAKERNELMKERDALKAELESFNHQNKWEYFERSEKEKQSYRSRVEKLDRQLEIAWAALLHYADKQTWIFKRTKTQSGGIAEKLQDRGKRAKLAMAEIRRLAADDEERKK